MPNAASHPAIERPALAVDLVLMTVRDGAPAVLVLRRPEAPFAGDWALPGGLLRSDETLEDAARRILRDKARMDEAYLEQLYTFGALDRDPRGRIVSVAYLALIPAERFDAALAAAPDLKLAKVVADWPGETGGPADIEANGARAPLAFDHRDILGMALLRLRGKLDYSSVAFALLPQRFTLRALQDVYEAILDVSLHKPAFRRRMLDKGWLAATGERETGASFRPAELYRRRGA